MKQSLEARVAKLEREVAEQKKILAKYMKREDTLETQEKDLELKVSDHVHAGRP